MTTVLKRHPTVAHRRLPLSEQSADAQIKRGLSVFERGEPFALPVDRLAEPDVFRARKLWQQDSEGKVSRRGIEMESPSWLWVPKMWKAADAITGGRARVLRNMLAFGHDVHVTNFGNLYARHWHAGWANPFTGQTVSSLDPTFETLRTTHFVSHECDLPVCPAVIWSSWDQALIALSARRGFVEECGWVSGGLVTVDFVSEEIDELFSTTGTEYADFDFHEVGTSAAAEVNTQSILTATSGITLVNGTPTDADPIYREVATITADATETWEEHGLFNIVAAGAMMDRSLTGGQAVTSSDTVEYTYELTKVAE
jgi:hypothetical protein